jgi:hypothetical protein
LIGHTGDATFPAGRRHRGHSVLAITFGPSLPWVCGPTSGRL